MQRKLLFTLSLLTAALIGTAAAQNSQPGPAAKPQTAPADAKAVKTKQDKPAEIPTGKKGEKAPQGKELSRKEIDAFLAKPESIFVQDLREDYEIRRIGTLPGYVNIPLAKLEERIAEVPRNKIILPVSNHAVRALKGLAILKKHGYKVPGGIGVQHYQEQGGTLFVPPPKTQGIGWSSKGFTAGQRKYWAYQPVRPVPVPKVKNTKWVRNAIDSFILEKLETAGISPAPEADRATLLRRVTLDVTGILPTPEEEDAFLRDTSPTAYEKVVDRLLASPAFGENWSRAWLDVARYGDTDGYIQDQRRPTSWRYRDWVIEAINTDKPYDQFVKEQIAGDEIKPEDPKAFIATGFLRGYQDEFNARNIGLRRQEILNDVTDTTAAAFLGQTASCARCHDHKFDAIRQEDYYRLQAFFSNAVPRDNHPVLTGKELEDWKAKRTAWETATKDIRDQIETLIAPGRKKAFEQRLPGFVPADRVAITKADNERTPLEKWIYARYQWRETGFEQAAIARLRAADIGDTAIVDNEKDPAAQAKLKADRAKYKELNAKLKEFAALDPGPLPVAFGMTEETPVPPATHILTGGLYGNDGKEVEPGFLAVLNPEKPVIVPNTRLNSTGRRTALANWIANPKNPLTARVAVNRLWAGHFGRGIVATPSDFGVMGEYPTHPELLDYLAGQFVQNGWSQKAIHREILLSSTYRQASNFIALAQNIDARNRLFSRFPRLRLPAEAIRDSALAAAGLLQNEKVGGPAFQPPLPKELQQGGGRSRTVATDDPKEYNRRSVYIAVRRNQPDPTMEVFDTPPSFDPCPRRNVSTTAPQALTLLNSEQVLSWSEALAGRAIREAGDDTARQVERVYKILFARSPDSAERRGADEFLTRQHTTIQKRIEAGETIALPAGAPEPKDKAQAAAFVDLCHALLNSNEFIYRF